jgi:hypothetical protein
MTKQKTDTKTPQNHELADFMNYIQSPKKLILSNLLAGIFRGIGGVIGATLVVALLVYLLNVFIDFPLIGQYFQDIKTILETATQS